METRIFYQFPPLVLSVLRYPLAAVLAHIAGGTVEEFAEGAVHVRLIEITVIHRRIQQGFGLLGGNISGTELQLYQLTEELGREARMGLEHTV